MKNESKSNIGLKLLIKKYKTHFEIPENTNFYSKSDYLLAEKKFLKFALTGRYDWLLTKH